MKKKIKYRTVLSAIILGLVLTVTGCGSKQEEADDGVTNILDYVTVDFDGKNGEGTAYVSVDYDGLETEMVGGQEKINEMSDVEDLEELTTYINAVASISLSIDKNSGLSNGDKVTVSVTYDESAASSASVDFGTEMSRIFTVSGLES